MVQTWLKVGKTLMSLAKYGNKNKYLIKLKSNPMINIKTISAAELKTLSLNDIVSICKSFDRNGQWDDVTPDEYDYILETATNFINEYQN